MPLSPVLRRHPSAFLLAAQLPSLVLYPTMDDSTTVLPISSPARALVMLEQFAGVGYIAAIVSRLIGLAIVRSHDGRS